MAEFMAEHPALAKNLLPNCSQGKETANRLWKNLTKQLNAVGPAIKDVKLWKKVFAGQKYNAKRKLSFNKASKRRTGGGPFQEKVLTPAEELLVEAAELEVCVERNQSVPSYGNAITPSAAASSSKSDEESNSSQLDLPSTSARCNTPARCITPARRVRSSATPKCSEDTKKAPLEENLKMTAEHQKNMGEQFDKMIDIHERQLQIGERQLEINERMLQIKEEKHRAQMVGKEVDLKIKSLELEALQRNFRK